jgi:arginase
VQVDLSGGDYWSRLVGLYDHVAERVAAIAETGEAAVALTGDCTISIGMAAGLQRAGVEPSIVWIDAHGDLQTLETTSSGYVGGMALRFLLGYRPSRITRPLGLRPPAEEQVLLLDARDLEPAEADHIEETGLRRLPLAGLAASDLPEGPLLVNLDLDTLDPAVLPGLRYPAANGPDDQTLLQAVRTVLESRRVAALNLACTWRSDPSPPTEFRKGVVAAVLALAADHPFESRRGQGPHDKA